VTSRRAQYVRAAGSGFIAKILSMGAGIVTLWLLNQILEKADFGAYSFTMSIVGLVSILAAGGLDQSVLYRLSRVDERPGKLDGGDYISWVLRVVVLTGFGTAAVLVAGGLVLASRSDLPGLTLWFLILSVIAPLSSVGKVFASWNQAQLRVDRSLIVPRLSEISRAAFLYAVLVVAPTPTGVALAVVGSMVVPLVAWLLLIPRDSYRPPRRLPRGDVAYGVKLLLTTVAERGVRNIDLIMVGILGSSVLAADYAVAARLVALTTLGHELLGAVLTPRMARFIETKDYSGLSAEYNLTRALALGVALAIASGFTAVGQQLVVVFGDYANAWPVLLILCAAYVVNVGSGSSGRYLNMAGYAEWNLLMTVLLLVAMGGFNLLLIPQYGARGAALATLSSFASINALQALVIWWKDRFATIHPEPLIILAAAVSLIVLAAHDHARPVHAAVGLGALSLVSARRGWPIARRLLTALRNRNGRGASLETT